MLMDDKNHYQANSMHISIISAATNLKNLHKDAFFFSCSSSLSHYLLPFVTVHEVHFNECRMLHVSNIIQCRWVYSLKKTNCWKRFRISTPL